MNKVKNIAELHDDFLNLLLEYREKYNSNLTCALRTSRHRAYLDEGYWFFKKNKVFSTYFVLEENYFKHLELTVNKYGDLSLSLDLLIEYFDVAYNDFSKKIALNLDKGIGYLGDFNLNIREKDFKEKFIRLLKIVDDFLNSEEFKSDEDFNTISQKDFDRNLKYILKILRP